MVTPSPAQPPQAAARTRILDAAERVFADNGFGGANLRAIADAAGVAPGLLSYHFGGKDELIPDHQVETIREALESAGTKHEIVIYPKADHGFFCDQRATYNADAAEDAWTRVQKLFSEELGS